MLEVCLLMVNVNYVALFAMKCINPSKALGPDELQGTGNGIRSGIHPSIDTGEILKEWSLANICPLFKKSDRSLVHNFDMHSL